MQVAGIRTVGARVELIEVGKPRPLAGDEVLRNWQAVADPLTSRYPVSAPRSSPAPTTCTPTLPANRLQVATDWFNGIIEHRQFVQLKLIPSEYSGLTAAEHRHLLPDSPLRRRRCHEPTRARQVQDRCPGSGG
jgi:hypothetical protein